MNETIKPFNCLVRLRNPNASGIQDGTAWEVRPARYAQKMICVRHESNNTYKARGSYLADVLNGRWTHRDRGYLMSQTKAEMWLCLLLCGWDGSTMGTHLTHADHPGVKFILKRGRVMME